MSSSPSENVIDFVKMFLPNNTFRRKGFSLLELVISLSILTLAAGILVLTIDPVQMKNKGRDATRLADTGAILQAVESYTVDNEFPPDDDGLLRRSDVSVSENQSPQLSNGSGWIGVDLSGYMEKIPTDTLNAWPYVYRYKRVGKKFELDTALESYRDLMISDNGNDDIRYERGTDLTIL